MHPLSGEVRDGYIWGRGAVDMKNMVASVPTVVRERLRSVRLFRRPLVLAFFADEENAGVLGAQWAVAHHPDLFEGCRGGHRRATHLQRLGIECFGFHPLALPDDLDFWALFHGIDERVPVESLHFSTRVLDRFLDLY